MPPTVNTATEDSVSPEQAPDTEKTVPNDATPRLRMGEMPAALEVRDAAKRELGLRIVPWDMIVETRDGLEQFKRGAFSSIDPKTVKLRMEHENPVAGRGISLEERDDAAYMVFRVSKTPRGDEILALASDGVTDGASVGFYEIAGGTRIETNSGRRVMTHERVDLREVSTTWQPAYQQAGVVFVRSQAEQKESIPMSETAAPVAEQPAAPVIHVPAVDITPVTDAIAGLRNDLSERSQADRGELLERIAKLEEEQRKQFTMPGGKPAPLITRKSELFDKVKAGNPVPFRMRVIDDVTVADQDAMLPAYVGEMDDVLNTARPFLETTREIPVPDEGTAVQLPKITQHTEVGVQATEKTEVASRALKTDLDTYNMITVAGAVDVSLQFLKRAPASIRALLFDDMAAEYAALSDSEAIDALLGAAVNDGGALDPEALALGEAFINAYAVNRGRLPADTIWLSTAAVGAFIDANDDQTNKPLYGSIAASATVPGGITGSLRGLRPVHVPALTTVDAIVGPSRGFVWAEDGTYRLESDNPALAGRDIGIVGFLFLMPRYAAAFTTYALGS